LLKADFLSLYSLHYKKQQRHKEKKA